MGGTVDTSKVGEYITYEAVDKHNNKGIATRKVIVEDTTAPVIEVIGGDVRLKDILNILME